MSPFRLSIFQTYDVTVEQRVWNCEQWGIFRVLLRKLTRSLDERYAASRLTDGEVNVWHDDARITADVSTDRGRIEAVVTLVQFDGDDPNSPVWEDYGAVSKIASFELRYSSKQRQLVQIYGAPIFLPNADRDETERTHNHHVGVGDYEPGLRRCGTDKLTRDQSNTTEPRPCDIKAGVSIFLDLALIAGAYPRTIAVTSSLLPNDFARSGLQQSIASSCKTSMSMPPGYGPMRHANPPQLPFFGINCADVIRFSCAHGAGENAMQNKTQA